VSPAAPASNFAPVAADAAPVIRLAVDLMGGDHGPSVTLPACRAFLAAHPAAELVLVGREEALAQAAAWPRCTCVVASEVVEMTDSVETALRKKKDSSLRVAVSQVKPHADRPSLAQACVSAGNTGALMAVSRYVLKTIEGIDRPAIATVMPNERDGFTTVLDLGANVDCSAEHLLQFAVMGSVYARVALGLASPRVALLSIGQEETKGNELTREAHRLLKGSALGFIGNVEAQNVYSGEADVIVCDGFTGNVALKISEGLVDVVETLLSEELSSTFARRVGSLLTGRALRHFRRRLDYSEYGGAPLLGVAGVAIVGHGRSSALAVRNAVAMAHRFASDRFIERVERDIAAVSVSPS
jgi:phosphate acyltransferase